MLALLTRERKKEAKKEREILLLFLTENEDISKLHKVGHF
jgi:hypothetical protein